MLAPKGQLPGLHPPRGGGNLCCREKLPCQRLVPKLGAITSSICGHHIWIMRSGNNQDKQMAAYSCQVSGSFFHPWNGARLRVLDQHFYNIAVPGSQWPSSQPHHTTRHHVVIITCFSLSINGGQVLYHEPGSGETPRINPIDGRQCLYNGRI